MATNSDEHTLENCDKLWFAMRATFNRAMRAKRALEERSIESYIPMRYVVKLNRRGRQCRELSPVISNILFVCATRSDIQEAKSAIPWLQYMTTPSEGKRVPIVVPNKQMADFIRVTQLDSEKTEYLTPEEVSSICKGTKVKIVGGPFDGVEGTFICTRGRGKKRIVVSIPSVIAASTIIEEYDLLQVL